ncbi:MAG TPA: secondary thiamine-phosphate synthase enzyme YjbQ [Chloroflexota bacterium]|nr:secondary thiamine-phosphate synthase enzyme YjbQ [Chloroflexota bacterium]
MAAVIERVTRPSTNGHAKSAGATTKPTPADPQTTISISETPMRTLTRVVGVETERHLQFLDVTDEVTRSLAESGVQNGFAVVFSRHSTAGIRINEHEPLLLEDMATLLERVVPQETSYRHDDFSVRTVNLTEGERVNGHSHCRSLLLGASESVPVVGGRLLLGRWQRVFLVELDGPRSREYVIQIIGS